MKYKKGDKLRVKEGEAFCGNYNGWSEPKHIVIKGISGKSYVYDIYEGEQWVDSCSGCLKDEHLTPLVKTLNDLEVGDILVHGKYERRVLGVVGEVILISGENELEYYYDGRTVKQLENDGYKLKTTDPEPTELTVKGVEELLGYPVKIVKE